MMPHAKPRILFLLLFLINFISIARAADITTGLVGHWKLDGNGTDSSGNGNNGTVVGATGTSDRFATANSAMNFNGSTNNILIPHNAVLNPLTAITVTVWVKPNSGYGEINNPGIVSKRTGSWGGIWVSQSSGLLWGRIYQSSGSGVNLPINAVLSVDVWANVALVADPVDKFVREYINGIQVGSVAYDGTLNAVGTDQLLVGDQNGENFSGSIDDVRIYNRALTAADVLALYRGEPRMTGVTSISGVTSITF